MTDTKQNESKSKEETKATGCNCSNFDFESISQQFENFFQKDKDSFDFKTMMQEMCCSPKEADSKDSSCGC